MVYKAWNSVLFTTILMMGNAAYAGLPQGIASTRELEDEFTQKKKASTALDGVVQKAKASKKTFDVSFPGDKNGKGKKSSAKLYYVQSSGDLEVLFRLLSFTSKVTLTLEELLSSLHSGGQMMTLSGIIVRPNLPKLYSNGFQPAEKGSIAEIVQSIWLEDFKRPADKPRLGASSTINGELLMPANFRARSCHPCIDLAKKQIDKTKRDHRFTENLLKTDASTYDELKAARTNAKEAQNKELGDNVENDFKGFFGDPLALRSYIQDVMTVWSTYGLKRTWDQMQRAAKDSSEFDLFGKVPLALMTYIFDRIGELTGTFIEFYSASTSDSGPSNRTATLVRDATFGPQKAKNKISILWDSDVTGPTLTHLVGVGLSSKEDKKLIEFEDSQIDDLRRKLLGGFIIQRDQ